MAKASPLSKRGPHTNSGDQSTLPSQANNYKSQQSLVNSPYANGSLPKIPSKARVVEEPKFVKFQRKLNSDFFKTATELNPESKSMSEHQLTS